MGKITPAAAFCAVGPAGVIDIDLVRRNPASAQWAAGTCQGQHWPQLARDGWRIAPVRIVGADDPDLSSGPEASAGAKPAGRGARPAPAAVMIGRAEAPPPAPSGDGRMRLLRLGALP